jgi:hypothetical protein
VVDVVEEREEELGNHTIMTMSFNFIIHFFGLKFRAFDGEREKKQNFACVCRGRKIDLKKKACRKYFC